MIFGITGEAIHTLAACMIQVPFRSRMDSGCYKEDVATTTLHNERLMNGERIKKNDVLSGRGKLSFNHGKLHSFGIGINIADNMALSICSIV